MCQTKSEPTTSIQESIPSLSGPTMTALLMYRNLSQKDKATQCNPQGKTWVFSCFGWEVNNILRSTLTNKTIETGVQVTSVSMYLQVPIHIYMYSGTSPIWTPLGQKVLISGAVTCTNRVAICILFIKVSSFQGVLNKRLQCTCTIYWYIHQLITAFLVQIDYVHVCANVCSPHLLSFLCPFIASVL